MIGEPSLELLALRRYVQKEKYIDARWAWTTEQYRHNPLYAQTNREIEKVKEWFRTANPGYKLEASPFRDLERQVKLWKGNKKVHAGAADVTRKCVAEIMHYPDPPDPPAIKKFRSFLGRCDVKPKTTSAAPGLSDHGRMHAVDFVVKHGRATIASTSTEHIPDQWMAPPGWAQKLKAAITQSGSLFDGPLPDPPEPWHYTLRVPGGADV